MKDRRDRPERWYETWLRRRRERGCSHDFAPWATMRYEEGALYGIGDPVIEEWTCCRKCGRLDIRGWTNGVPWS